jgi:membrane-associated phospholipid phosphatase
MIRGEGAREVEINLLLGLVYDIMIVAFVKALTRRARPPGARLDDMFLTRGVDKFSFPSGHATRAIFVALFFTNWAFPEMSIIFKLALYIWAGSVAVSRVLLRRHYILDVVCGCGIGYLEFFLTGILWIGPGAAKVLGDWISTAEDE